MALGADSEAAIKIPAVKVTQLFVVAYGPFVADSLFPTSYLVSFHCLVCCMQGLANLTGK